MSFCSKLWGGGGNLLFFRKKFDNKVPKNFGGKQIKMLVPEEFGGPLLCQSSTTKFEKKKNR